MDQTQLYYDTIDTPEFKAFHKRVGGVVNSSPVQIKRATIQIEDKPGQHRWLFFSNGYVREQENSRFREWVASVLAKPSKDWNNNPTVEDMLILIAKGNARIDKREKTVVDRIDKMEKKAYMVLDALFTPENYIMKNRNSKFSGFWLKGRWQDIISRMYSAVCAKSKDSYQAIVRK